MIYCVEDESAIRDLMVYTLQVSGFDAQGFENDVDFWAAMKEQRPELIILDVMLPGEDGLTILRKLRSSPVTTDIPVIMATAKDSEYDKVIGLDSGADDYLAKPFGMMEMVSRIKAVLRRAGNRQPVILSYGMIVLDENRHAVTIDGKTVLLTLKEYELLKLFMESPGRVFTRDNTAVEIEVKKNARKASRKVKNAVETVEKEIKASEKKAKLEIIVQSPMGGNITAEEIAAKLPDGAETVFVRVDQNKLWWIRGEETGAVDIWD